MKIIMNDKIYIQKCDIAYLSTTSYSNQVSALTKLTGPGCMTINDKNKYEFIEYDSNDAIEFFKDLSIILDFNELNELSEEELFEIYDDFASKKNNIAKEFNSMTRESKLENKCLVEDSKKLDFLITTIKDLILYKRGELIIRLPKNKKRKSKRKNKK